MYSKYIEMIVALQESLLDVEISFIGQQKAGKSSLLTEITGIDCAPGKSNRKNCFILFKRCY